MVIKRNNQIVNGGKFLFTLVLLSLAVQSFSVYGESGVSPLNSIDKKRLSKEYKKEREEIFAKGDFLFEAAKKLDEQGKYAEAIEKCNLALETLNKVNGAYVNYKKNSITNYLNKLKRAWGTSLWQTAVNYFYIKNNYRSAAKFAKKAKAADSFFAERTEDLIKKCDAASTSVAFKKQTSLEAVDFDRTQRNNKAVDWLDDAKVMMDNKFYTEARDKLEAVLIIDPLNRNAGRMLKLVYTKLYQGAQSRRNAGFEDMLADATWRWISPVPPSDSVTIDLPSPRVASVEAGSLYDKLQSTIVPYVNWKDTSILTVISELKDMSVENDEERIGVNIISKLSVSSEDIPHVSIRFLNIPMIELVKYICQATGLNYSVEDNTLVIGDKGVTPVITRRFPIKNEFYSSILGGGGQSPDDIVAGVDEEIITGDDFIEESEGVGGAGNAEKSDDTALKNYFSNAGVLFGPDATITYNNRSSELIIVNTPAELRKIKNLIDQLDISTPMILIEAKLVELLETDIFELGFDWLFKVSDSSGDDYVAISPTVRSWAGPRNPNDIPTSQVGLNNVIIDKLRISPNLIEGNNTLLELTVYGLNSNSRNEVLSAPKIIATSGRSAFIQMVEKRYFPESWENPEVNVNDSTVQIIPPIPEFEDDGQDIGITFDVEATVATNNYTITLSVWPRVAAFAGYDKYPFSITQSAAGAIDYQGTIDMPIITRREVKSTIKLYDGESVVIGGIVKEEIFKREDKYPILGDIPLLGGFFGSQLDAKVKTNLLIFINARLVDYSGVPIRTVEKNGTPDFRR